jgi:hypothetical protein
VLRQQVRREVPLLEHVGKTTKGLRIHLPASTQSSLHIAGATEPHRWMVSGISVQVKAHAGAAEIREKQQ